jgi:hypothetical protein
MALTTSRKSDGMAIQLNLRYEESFGLPSVIDGPSRMTSKGKFGHNLAHREYRQGFWMCAKQHRVRDTCKYKIVTVIWLFKELRNSSFEST